MADIKKTHLRKCCGCGMMKDKTQLIRIIRDSEGAVLIDASQKRNGRGAYLCPDCECLETAVKRRSLERALRCSVDGSIYELLKEIIEADS